MVASFVNKTTTIRDIEKDFAKLCILGRSTYRPQIYRVCMPGLTDRDNRRLKSNRSIDINQ